MKLNKPVGYLNHKLMRKALIVLLFLPVLFLSNRASHDWGDDFAQYIHQAKNIVQGIPQSETGFIYSQVNYIGPTAYPSGFPLLLAPVYALFGNRILAFTAYLSIFYFILAFLVLAFYRKHFSPAAALVLTFILIYNPQFFLFKQEIMSDIPFTMFLVLLFLLYPGLGKDNYRKIALFSLLAGFLMMIRSVGFVLLLAILADQTVTIIRERKKTRLATGSKPPLPAQLLFPSLLIGLPVIVYFFFNSLVFRIPSGGSLHDYLAFYYSGEFLSSIPANLEKYIETLRFTYMPAVGAFRFVALVTGSLFLIMSIIGFVRKVSTRMELTDWFFIMYILILLVFPDNNSAYRLLVPVGFLLLYYAALGFKSIRLPFAITQKRAVIALGVLMAVLFLPGIIHITAGRNTTLDGPQQKESIEAFTHISRNLPDSAIVVFFKPRALALYTGKQGFADPFTEDPTLIHEQLTAVHAGYILVHNDLTREPMKRYIRIMRSRAKEIWKNDKYRLYRISKPDPSELY